MRLLKKKKSKQDAISSLKEKMEKKKKGQYTDIDQLHDLVDHRFSIKKEPIWRKHQLEDMKNQPMSKRNPDKEDLKHATKTAHKSAKEIEPPDEEEMEEEKEAAKKGNKKDRKKMAVLVISKVMDKKKRMR
ncbi:MAG TPA: hypothetical protein VFO37_04875 [Chitinophagaceae bacterium]|nr:hypothetical protein [Chitinophagaceae bacterium]